MIKYKDLLTESNGSDIGDTVGCGLDRLDRKVSSFEIQKAIVFYEEFKEKMNNFPVNARIKAVQEYMESNGILPDYLKT